MLPASPGAKWSPHSTEQPLVKEERRRAEEEEDEEEDDACCCCCCLLRAGEEERCMATPAPNRMGPRKMSAGEGEAWASPFLSPFRPPSSSSSSSPLPS